MGSYPETSIPIHSGSLRGVEGEGQKRQLCPLLPEGKILKQMILYVRHCISFTQRIFHETGRKAQCKNVKFYHDIFVIVNKYTWIFQSWQTSMQDVWHKYFNGSSKPPVSLKKYIYLSQNNLLLLFRFVSGFLTMASA